MSEQGQNAKTTGPAAWWTARAPLGRGAAFGLATLSAPGFAFAFPGIDIWPLAFVCHVPLLIALRGQTVARATWLGLAWGFVTTMIGFYWLVDMLEVFSGFGLPLCILFAAILCLYQAGLFALCTHLYARGARRGWPAGLMFAGAFATSELLFPLLFPWYFGACAHSVPILMQTADLGGPITVSLMFVASNLAIYALAEWRLLGMPLCRRTVTVGATVVLVALVYGYVRIRQIDARMASIDTVKIGMVQGNAKLGQRRGALEIHRQLTLDLKKRGAELVVWSEAAIPGAFDHRSYQRLVEQRVTRGLGVPIVMGGVIYQRLSKEELAKHPKGRRARFYNTALSIDAKGKVLGRYDKQFLLMFGEYLPFGETFPSLYEMSPNSGAFSPGTSFKPLPLGEHRLATMICYEDIIPSFVNKLVATETPDLLVNLTNDAWFGDTTEPWIHLALAKFRTVEHRRYLVRVTNSGVSAIVDPVGRIVVQGGTFKREALLGEARYMKSNTIYGSMGDAAWWLVSLLTIAAGFVDRRRLRPSAPPPTAPTPGQDP
jgi:apolipoprotein N-acyltransferase